MKLIGITGGIGAGKSVVSRVLRCRGYFVYDCDLEARRIMEDSAELKNALAARFGADCITDAGRIDRKRLAGYVFSDDANRLWLNSQVHSMVRDDLKKRLEHRSDALCFVEAAILKSSGLYRMCDRIWLVEASKETRLRRACTRDSACAADIEARMRSQQSEFDDFGSVPADVVDNNDDSQLLLQLDRLIEKALSVPQTHTEKSNK